MVTGKSRSHRVLQGSAIISVGRQREVQGRGVIEYKIFF